MHLLLLKSLKLLGRLLRVDLTTLEGGLKCPSVGTSVHRSVCTSVRTFVRPRSISNFNEIWYVDRDQ